MHMHYSDYVAGTNRGNRGWQARLAGTVDTVYFTVVPLVNIAMHEVRASQLAQASERGWFSNTSFTTGLKTLPTFRPDALVFFRAKMLLMIFALKKTRASGQNVGKVFNPVVKLVLENQPLSDCYACTIYTQHYS